MIAGGFSDNRRWNMLVLICFLVFGAYLTALAIRKTEADVIESTDSYFYLTMAEKAYAGESYTHGVYSPGYPWLVALLMHAGLESELAGRLVSALFSTLSAVVGFAILKRFFEEHIALIGCLSFILVPKYIHYSVSTLPYTTSAFFVWAVFLMALISRKRNLLSSLIAGALCGFGYIVRPENIIGIVVFLIFSRNAPNFLSFLVGFALSSMPYHLISLEEGNAPSILSKYILYRVPHIASEPNRGVQDAEEIIRSLIDVKDGILSVLANVHLSHKYAIPGLLSSSSLVLFGMGLSAVIKHWSELKKNITPFVVFSVIWIAPIAYLVTMVDYMFIQTLITFGAICGNSVKLIEKRKVIIGILLIFALMNVGWSARPFFSSDERLIYKITGRWILENFGKDRTIFEPHPLATFYARGTWSVSPDDAEICTMTDRDLMSSRARTFLPVFFSDGDERFELVGKLRYGGTESKVFVRRKTE